jgi:hypothetical protein
VANAYCFDAQALRLPLLRMRADGRDLRRRYRHRDYRAGRSHGEGAGEVVAAETGRDQAGSRGQRAGAFRRDMPRQWLITATYSLMHAAAEDTAAGRLDAGDAAGLITAALLAAFSPQQGG